MMLALKCVLIALLLVVPSYAQLFTKSLAGPPEEFEEHRLPEPARLANLQSSSGLIPVHFESTGESSIAWASQLPIDSTKNFTFTFFSNIDKPVEISLAPPSHPRLQPLMAFKGNEKNKISRTEGSFGVDGLQIPAVTYLVEDPEEGMWDVRIEVTGLEQEQKLKLTTGNSPVAYFLLDNYSPYKTFSHLSSYDLVVGNEIGVVARLFDENHFNRAKANGLAAENDIPAALHLNNFMVNLDVVFPDGKEEIFEMNDEGLHGDLTANDGSYTATLTATEAGKYTAQVVMKGFDPEGQPFLRTTQHVLDVIEPQLSIPGQFAASASVRRERDDLEIRIPVNLLKQVTRGNSYITRYKAYSEVWGKNANGKDTPIAWVSGIVEIVEVNGKTYLPLSLNLNWITRAAAQEPYILRNFHVQDVDTSIPIARVGEIPVNVEQAHTNLLRATLMNRPAVTEITEQMMMGPRPLQFVRSNSTNEVGAPGGKLVLVHGYCSGSTPFSVEDFTDYVIFQDYNKARSNDQFARLISEVGRSYPSFSVYAHSQGGLAALHMYTFYWSGADTVPAGKRVIQSIGSPYQGNSLAGSMASIGKVFGVGCGTVYDLTVEGAGLWLTSIPRAARKQVYYYTTQYKDLSWCNLAANAILKWPNDGTAEKKYSDLPDANNLGHKKGWCHSKDMKYAEQCKDHTRNAEVNRAAAR